jgi:hypothetical protein
MTRSIHSSSISVTPPPRRRALDAPATWGKTLIIVVLLIWGYSLVAGFRTAILYLTLVGLAALAGGVFSRVLGLLGVGILCTLDAAARVYILTGGLFRWNTFNFILIFVALLSLRQLAKVREVPVRMAAALLVFLSFCLIFSPDLTNGLQHLTGLVSFFGLVAYCLRGGGAESWHWVAAVCGTLGACGGFVFNLQKSTLPFINPNAWSYFPLTAMLTVCIALSFKTRKQRPILILLAAVNGAWAFLSGSRGAMFVAFVCAMYIVVMTRGLGSKMLLIGGAVSIAIALTFQFAVQSDYARQRMERFLNPAASLASRTSGRSELMLGAWYLFRNHPFGVGTGGFTTAWERMTFVPGFSYFQIGQDMAAHSAWAKVLAENGAIGFALLFGFVSSFAYCGWQKRASRVFPVGALATVVLAVAFTNTEFQSKGLWLLAAAALVILRRGVQGVRRPVRPEQSQVSARSPVAASTGYVR